MVSGLAGWRLSMLVPEALVMAFADAVEPLVDTVTLLPGDLAWRVEAFSAGADDPRPRLVAAVALTAASLGVAEPPLAFEAVAARDWLAENRRAFPPIAIGRFFVHGSHFTGRVPAGRRGILMDAATAFGSGEHPSTQGCLRAISSLARARRWRRVLDVGCGSGILMIAAAKLRPCRGLGVDIDPQSAVTALANARLNGVGRRLSAIAGNGYADRRVRVGRPYDLILANILARPLCRLSRDLGRALAPGGVAVLSGLLERQAAQVVAAHRRQGLRLAGRVRIGEWTTLILRG